MCGAQVWALPPAVQRIARQLQDTGQPYTLQMLPTACHDFASVAQALGVEIEHLVRTQRWRRHSDGTWLQTLSAATCTVDPQRLAAWLRSEVDTDAQTAQPICAWAVMDAAMSHTAMPTLMERALLAHDLLWTNAGHPQAWVASSGPALQILTQATLVDLAPTATADAD